MNHFKAKVFCFESLLFEEGKSFAKNYFLPAYRP